MILRILFLCSVCVALHGQSDTYEQRAASILAMPLDTLKLDSLRYFARELKANGSEDAIRYQRIGLSQAEAIEAWSEAALLSSDIAIYHYDQRAPDSSGFYFDRSLEHAQRSGNQRRIGQAYYSKHRHESMQGNYEKAIEFALAALEAYTLAGDAEGIAESNLVLGITYYYMRNFPDAIKYAERALEIQQENELTAQMGITNQLFSDTYLNMGELEKAEPYNAESLRIRREMGNPRTLAFSLNSRANLFLYMDRENESIELYKEVLEIGRQHPDMRSVIGPATNNLAEVYSRKGRYREALDLFLPLATRLEETDDKGNHLVPEAEKQLVSTYLTIADAYNAMGKFDSAYHYHILHKAVNDSLFTRSSNDRIAELETQYEVKEQEATIDAQQIELDHREQRQRWTMLGLLAAALLGGIIFYLYRRQHRVSKELARKNEQNEFLVKEIHHRTKNNLLVLSSLLDLQSDYITDPAALDAVIEGSNRVQSIGLLHQQLYTGAELEMVDPKKYFSDLGGHLLDTFGREDEVQIQYAIDLPEMPVDEAISLGLIANELLTNSLKYAYPNGTEGKIYFDLHQDGRQKVLRVRDEGGGPKTTTPQGTGFGRDLVELLREKLNGTLREEASATGWTTTVRW